MTNYRTILPPPELRNYIRYYWIFEHENIGDEPYIYRSMADGSVEMLFHYSGQFRQLDNSDNIVESSSALSMVHGTSSNYSRFITEENFGIFGVYLYPYAVPFLFNISSSSLSNQSPDLDLLIGREASFLEEQIMMADSNEKRISIMNRFFMSTLKNDLNDLSSVNHSIRSVIHSRKQLSVEALAARYFLSTRQFERKFKEFSGFTPKVFGRIIRFHSALHRYGLQFKSLTDIGYECGYYDQAHFIHDFKEFSGYHPKTYFHGETEGMEVRGKEC